MTYNQEIHHRRSTRLKGYDYLQTGAYFVTVCSHNRECLFGDIVDGEMVLNEYGQIVSESWKWLGVQYDHVELDAWMVMPNHMHGIIVINHDRRGSSCRGGSRTAPTNVSVVKPKPVGRLIRAFKAVSPKQINRVRNTPGIPVWQRNYYDHIIRDERSLEAIRDYIINNPAQFHAAKGEPVKKEIKKV